MNSRTKTTAQADGQLHIRQAHRDDAAAMLTIYAPIVEQTTISFEEQVPSTSVFGERIDAALAEHQWLVAESDGSLVGYAYGTAHRARAAYRFSAETSVYVAPAQHGAGVARRLYQQLLADLAALGYFHAFAGITMPNDPSVAFHRAAGFESIGTFPQVGYKQGRWHDVSWWHRPLQPGEPQVEPGRSHR